MPGARKPMSEEDDDEKKFEEFERSLGDAGDLDEAADVFEEYVHFEETEGTEDFEETEDTEEFERFGGVDGAEVVVREEDAQGGVGEGGEKIYDEPGTEIVDGYEFVRKNELSFFEVGSVKVEQDIKEENSIDSVFSKPIIIY